MPWMVIRNYVRLLVMLYAYKNGHCNQIAICRVSEIEYTHILQIVANVVSFFVSYSTAIQEKQVTDKNANAKNVYVKYCRK